MKKNFAVVAAALILLSACAKTPESIAPAYVSPMTYQSFNCQQIAAEQARVTQALNQVSAQQRQARTNDTVGVIFLGLPVSSLSGGNVADQVAALKGQQTTLEQERIASQCVIAPPTSAPMVVPTGQTPGATAPSVTPAAPTTANAPVVRSGIAIAPLPTQTTKLPGHRVVGTGCPGFAPRKLYAESPAKLPKNCEKVDAL